jgi:hypothetical protein
MKGLSKFKLRFGHPKQPYIYAVTAGKYLGELLVYAETTAGEYVFLTLPDMKIRRIPTEKFDLGIKDRIVDVVQKLPAYVHKTCMQQYKKNKTSFVALEDDDD